MYSIRIDSKSERNLLSEQGNYELTENAWPDQGNHHEFRETLSGQGKCVGTALKEFHG
jgi:hypothetical protein